MNTRCHAGRFILIVAAFCLPSASFAQLKVLMSKGFSAAYEEALPEFEKSSGISVTTTYGQSQGSTPTAIGVQLRRGVPADVVIMAREGLDELIVQGRIVKGTDVDLAKTPMGLSQRAGMPKPDIATVEAFKQLLLHAKSVTFPSSTTGIYLETKLFPQLGIAADMAGKITHTGVADVAKGEAEYAIQPVSELLHVPGTDFVGTLPPEIQYISVFSIAVVDAKQLETSKRLIDFLRSATAAKAIRYSGMEPLASK
jgi:molybdate transport system substrate-binding protein